VLLQNLEIRFDGIAVTPDVVPGFQAAPEEESPPTDGTGPRAIVMRGAVPQPPRVLSWRCGFLYGSYPVIVSSGERAVAWVQGTRVSEPIALTEPVSPIATVLTYVRLGITHVVPGGLDHVLFVLGVFLLSTRPRDLVAQVSTFTLAHSLTLGLGLAGAFSVPAAIVEPLIALSIACVAVENVIESRVRKPRLVVVFAFGLLHGLGFAGVLSEIGAAPDRFFHALLGFNVGVEVGQLTVVAVALAVTQRWRRDPVRYRQVLAVPASCALAVIGVCWTIIRVVG
jgi:hydrogenase/urease accessory protein HupE